MLTKYLILSMFLSGLAWATNIHTIAAFNHTDGQQQLAQSLFQGHEIDVELCDHCCHSAAHMIGILCHADHTYSAAGSIQVHFYVSTLYSFIHTPPTPPPTIT